MELNNGLKLFKNTLILSHKIVLIVRIISRLNDLRKFEFNFIKYQMKGEQKIKRVFHKIRWKNKFQIKLIQGSNRLKNWRIINDLIS